MKRILTFLMFVILTGISAFPAFAASDSITINPLGIFSGIYVVDFEHSIEGNAAWNGCVTIYDRDQPDSQASGHSYSLEFKQYLNSEPQQGTYFGLSGTYYDITEDHDTWLIEEGHSFSLIAYYGYRNVFTSGFTLDGGVGAGIIQRDDNENDFVLTARVQIGAGW